MTPDEINQWHGGGQVQMPQDPVQSLTETPVPPEPNAVQASPSQDPEKPKSMKKLFLVIGVVLVLLGFWLYKSIFDVRLGFDLPPEYALPSPTPEAMVEEDMSDWETYTNIDYLYTIKYPKTEFGIDTEHWELFESETTSFSSPYNSIACCGLSLDAVVNVFVEELTTPREFLPISEYPQIEIVGTIFNSYDAQVISTPENTQKWIFIDRGEKTYILNSWGSISDEGVRDQILSTFQFIGPSEAQ